MTRLFSLAAMVALLLATCPPAHAQAPSVRPGAPGQPSQATAPAAPPAAARPAAADVVFMQGMIGHHAQALDMTALVPTRTTNHALQTLAQRIEVSQRDEIGWMQRWLREHGETAPEIGAPMHHDRTGMDHDMAGMDHAAMARMHHPDTTAMHAMHDMAEMHHADTTATHHDGMDHSTMHHDGMTCTDKGGMAHDGMACMDGGAMAHDGMAGMDHALMPGMLSAAEMAELAGATGADFDRLFLRYMIRHHEGGLIMVADLLATPGGAQAPEVFRIATDIDADQRADIKRMLDMLDGPPLPSPTRHQ